MKGAEGTFVVRTNKGDYTVSFGCPLMAFSNYYRVLPDDGSVVVSGNSSGHPLEFTVIIK